jgi:hypothetical protein
LIALSVGIKRRMTILTTILGIIFAFIAVGLLGTIALFYSCDRAALAESKKKNER